MFPHRGWEPTHVGSHCMQHRRISFESSKLDKAFLAPSQLDTYSVACGNLITQCHNVADNSWSALPALSRV